MIIICMFFFRLIFPPLPLPNPCPVLKEKTAHHRRRRWRRESLAEDLRRLAEAKRRVRREEAEEVPVF